MPGTIGIEGYANLLARNSTSVSSEDSAFSIANLVFASKPSADLGDFVRWCSRREESDAYRYLGLPEAGRRAVNPFWIEPFAQRILGRLGIRTAPTRIMILGEARSLPDNTFIFKFARKTYADAALRADFLFRDRRAMPDLWCLGSKIITDAATVDFVGRKFGCDSGRDQSFPFSGMCAKAGKCSDSFGRYLTAAILKKECPAADTLYSKFDPSAEELRQIRAAVRWDGPQYLKICAARVFVGCSAPHNSNVLVTRSGELVSIDHCTAYYEDGDDLRRLCRYVNPDSFSYRVLGEIAALTEDDICASVAEVPRHAACGSTAGLAEYFTKRLRLWQTLYAGRTASGGVVAQHAV